MSTSADTYCSSPNIDLYIARRIQKTLRIVDFLPRRPLQDRYLPEKVVQADYRNPSFERRAIANVLIPDAFDG